MSVFIFFVSPADSTEEHRIYLNQITDWWNEISLEEPAQPSVQTRGINVKTSQVTGRFCHIQYQKKQ